MKIGILGGTFDPVHTGHVALSRAVISALSLDKFLFIPNARPPHKHARNITPYEHRTAMLKIAIEDCDGAQLCEIEANASSPNYTIDTLAILRKTYGPDAELVFFLGTDELKDLADWRSPRNILREATVVVVLRPGWDFSEIDRLEKLLGAEAVASLRENVFAMELPDISSTQIRRKAARTFDLGGDVHPGVAAYISGHSLYK